MVTLYALQEKKKEKEKLDQAAFKFTSDLSMKLEYERGQQTALLDMTLFGKNTISTFSPFGVGYNQMFVNREYNDLASQFYGFK